MTEAEWLTSTDPDQMLRVLRGKATDRQFRLFAVACARDELDHAQKTQFAYNFGRMYELGDEKHYYWDPLDGYEAAIKTAEAWADGLEGRGNSRWFIGWYKGIDDVADIADAALGHDPDGLVVMTPEQIAHTIQGYQTNPAYYLHDIIGNPFRPTTFDLNWRTSTVIALARSIYESRDYGPMPILSDALQDAGCENEEILSHCRGDGPHVRGCWVVDLILGKE